MIPRLATLIASFHTLAGRACDELPDVRAIVRNHSNSNGTRAAARFVLHVAMRADFDVKTTIPDWDREQQAAFRAWEAAPWFVSVEEATEEHERAVKNMAEAGRVALNDARPLVGTEPRSWFVGPAAIEDLRSARARWDDAEEVLRAAVRATGNAARALVLSTDETHTVDLRCARPTHAGREGTCPLCHPGAPKAPELFRCCGDACPGLPWKASDRPHPAACCADKKHEDLS